MFNLVGGPTVGRFCWLICWLAIFFLLSSSHSTSATTITTTNHSLPSSVTTITNNWLYVRFHTSDDESVTECINTDWDTEISSSNKTTLATPPSVGGGGINNGLPVFGAPIKQLTHMDGIRELYCQSNQLFLQYLLSLLYNLNTSQTKQNYYNYNHQINSTTIAKGDTGKTFYFYQFITIENYSLMNQSDRIYGHLLLFAQSDTMQAGCGGLNAEPDIVIPIFYTRPLSFHEPYLLLEGCIDLEIKDADHKQLISLTSTDYSITNTMPMDTDLYGGGLGYVFERFYSTLDNPWQANCSDETVSRIRITGSQTCLPASTMGDIELDIPGTGSFQYACYQHGNSVISYHNDSDNCSSPYNHISLYKSTSTSSCYQSIDTIINPHAYEKSSVYCYSLSYERGRSPTKQPSSLLPVLSTPTVAPTKRWTPLVTFTISFVMAPIIGAEAIRDMLSDDSMRVWLLDTISTLLNLANNGMTMTTLDTMGTMSHTDITGSILTCDPIHCLTLTTVSSLNSSNSADDDSVEHVITRTLTETSLTAIPALRVSMNLSVNIVDYYSFIMPTMFLLGNDTQNTAMEQVEDMTTENQNVLIQSLLTHFREKIVPSTRIQEHPDWVMLSTWLVSYFQSWFGEDTTAIIVSHSNIEVIHSELVPIAARKVPSTPSPSPTLSPSFSAAPTIASGETYDEVFADQSPVMIVMWCVIAIIAICVLPGMLLAMHFCSTKSSDLSSLTVPSLTIQSSSHSRVIPIDSGYGRSQLESRPMNGAMHMASLEHSRVMMV